jgi:hypothetical protein
MGLACMIGGLGLAAYGTTESDADPLLGGFDLKS